MDEWPLAQAVASRWSNIEHVPIRAECISPLTGIVAARSGRIEGLIQWIRLDYLENVRFENQPPVQSPSRPRFYVFPQGFNVQTGDLVSLLLEHDRKHIYVSPVAGSGDPVKI